jgi:ribosomal protein S18 acetylase RimI-like enzyme
MMAREKIDPNAIIFRSTQPADAKVASRLLFETFPQKATYIIGLGDPDRAKRILRDLFEMPGHRLSYSVTEAATFQGRIVGLLTAFPGRRLSSLDRKLDRLVLGQYSLRGKLALFKRGWPLVFIKESTRKEYFLSNLVVQRRFRSRGVGERMLFHIQRKAQEAGVNRVSLMVAIENQRARCFYESHGFKTEAIHLESNARVAHLGAGHLRMVKQLN